jgi:hypothetical protein
MSVGSSAGRNGVSAPGTQTGPANGGSPRSAKAWWLKETSGRFLFRASLWIITMLVLWWFGLQSPMLYLLQMFEQVTLRLVGDSSNNSIVDESGGDWTFRMSVDDRRAQRVGDLKVNRIEFTMPRADVALFTFSTPLYWGIVLAGPLKRSGLRCLLWGTLAVATVEVFSLFGLLEITASAMLASSHSDAGPLAAWARQFGNYLLVGVIPFVTPVIAAPAFHRDVREQIFLRTEDLSCLVQAGRRLKKRLHVGF